MTARFLNRAPRLGLPRLDRRDGGYDSPMPSSRSPFVSAPLLPLIRVVVAWSFVTAAALCGPCHAPAPAPAFAAEIAP